MLDTQALTPNKYKLLEACFYALLQADEDKIQDITKEYYSNDTYCEEQCTVYAPEIRVVRTGISHDLYLNNKSCIDESLEL